MEKILERQPKAFFHVLGGSKKAKLSKISNFRPITELWSPERPFFPPGTHLKIGITEAALKNVSFDKLKFFTFVIVGLQKHILHS